MSSLGSPIASGRTAEISTCENNCVLKLTRSDFPAHLADPTFPSLHERIHWSISQSNFLKEKQKSSILGLLELLPDAATLCHADFHPQNILLADTGPMVIDWEGSLHGEPEGDVANTCLWFRPAFMAGSGPRGWRIRQIGRRFEKV